MVSECPQPAQRYCMSPCSHGRRMADCLTRFLHSLQLTVFLSVNTYSILPHWWNVPCLFNLFVPRLPSTWWYMCVLSQDSILQILSNRNYGSADALRTGILGYRRPRQRTRWCSLSLALHGTLAYLEDIGYASFCHSSPMLWRLGPTLKARAVGSLCQVKRNGGTRRGKREFKSPGLSGECVNLLSPIVGLCSDRCLFPREPSGEVEQPLDSPRTPVDRVYRDSAQ